MTDFASNGHEQERPESLRDMLRSHIVEQRDFNKKIDRLHSIVLGDTEAGQDGLAQTVKKHGQYISMDKKMKYIGTGLAASGATGWAFLDSIKHFFGIK